MNNLHKTKDGQIIYISEMEDSHLINTIKLKIRQINQLKSIVNGQSENSIKAAIYGLNYQLSKEKAKESLYEMIGSLGCYVAETVVRGNSDTIRKLLTDALERDSKDTVSPGFIMNSNLKLDCDDEPYLCELDYCNEN